MIANTIDVSFEIKVIGKLLLVFNKESVPVLIKDLIIDEIEIRLSLCVSSEGVIIRQPFFEPSIP